MDSLLLILGVILLLFVSFDAFVTIFSLHGGGPGTLLLGRVLWKLLLKLHRRRAIHGVLSWFGPVMMVLIVLVWYLTLGTGWYLIFLSSEVSVVDSTTKIATNPLEKLYFLGTTLSDLGYGDLVPSLFPWTVLSTLVAFTATILTSAALSYVLPVVSAGVQKRQLANSLHNLGETAEHLLACIWPGGDQGLNSFVLTRLTQVEGFAHQHMSYPVLLYFHSQEQDQSMSLAMLKLADALFLIGCGAADNSRPPIGFRHITNNIVREYAILTCRHLGTSQPIDKERGTDIPAHLSLRTLDRLGLPTVGEAEFQQQLERYLPLRAKLVDICVEDGWLCPEKKIIIQ